MDHTLWRWWNGQVIPILVMSKMMNLTQIQRGAPRDPKHTRGSPAKPGHSFFLSRCLQAGDTSISFFPM